MASSSHKDPVGDSLESSKMSFEQKRQLVYELSKNPDKAFQVLKAWTCNEIRQILYVESEKERRFTGLAKDELISILLKTVEKNIEDREVEERSSSPKRQRKDLDPLHNVTPSSAKTKGKGTICCKNLACQAILLRGKDTFCKRCTCCICYKYDDNKDPSLWLTCNSDPPFDGESCGFSCHLECAFNTEQSGLKVNKPTIDVDGCFFCVYCGKRNTLLECWKKQMVIAVETEDVSKLRHCLLVAQKLLKGTEKYKALVEEAAESLVAGLDLETPPESRGPLLDLPLSKCKGSINRIDSTVTDVKNHCASALKLLDGLSIDESNVSTQTFGEEEAVEAILDLKIPLRNCNNLPPPPLETGANSEGKRVILQTDSDVRQMEQNTSSEERQLRSLH